MYEISFDKNKEEVLILKNSEKIFEGSVLNGFEHLITRNELYKSEADYFKTKYQNFVQDLKDQLELEQTNWED